MQRIAGNIILCLDPWIKEAIILASVEIHIIVESMTKIKVTLVEYNNDTVK